MGSHYRQPYNLGSNVQYPAFIDAQKTSKFNPQFRAPTPFQYPARAVSSAQLNANQLQGVNYQASQQAPVQQVSFTANNELNYRIPPSYNAHGSVLSQAQMPNANFPSCTISHSLPHNLPTYSMQPSFVQPVTNNVSLQSTMSHQNQTNTQSLASSVRMPPTEQVMRTLNTPGYFNVPYTMPPPPMNCPRNMAPGSYNTDFIRQPLPPAIPPNQNFVHQSTDISLTQMNPSMQGTALSASFSMMPQIFSPVPYGSETSLSPLINKPGWEKENKMLTYLERFSLKEKKNLKSDVTVVQFRSILKQGLSLVKQLMVCKENLAQMLHSDEQEWNTEKEKALQYQDQLIQACNFLTVPKNLNSVQKKLELIKKKRSLKKKLKQNSFTEKVKRLKQREDLNHEIDKWLDSIKEKNIKLKREAEMKKEADSILSEVRRKIQEAKRTIEKIKVFEKLRNVRQANAVKKGLFLPEHDQRFQNSISNLKETVLRQLSHYESEEKALKVMLEAEQEGQLEEETQWKIKRMRSLQQKRQNNIIECLFGDSEEPEKDDPIFLFYQYQNSGNKSIESLVQIRHHWDIHINENGEPIPHQWIIPIPPNSSGWEAVLKS